MAGSPDFIEPEIICMNRIYCLLVITTFIGCTVDNPGSEHISEALSSDTLKIPAHLQEKENLTALDPSQPPPYEISFTPREIYGEIYLNPIMSASGHHYNTVSVDRKGRVYIMDRLEENIHVYNPDGALLTKIGGEGRGPGEFIDMSTIRMDGDRLMTYGYSLKRIQWFNLDSYDVHVVNLNLTELTNDQGKIVLGTINSVLPLRNGSILIGGLSPADVRKLSESERTYLRYYSLDENGNLTSDELFQSVLEKLSHMALNENSPSDEGIVTVSPDGIIYRANTSQFLIHAMDVKDSTQRSFYYPYEHASVDREQVFEDHSDDFRTSMADVEFGDHWPALHSILADDDNRLWVSTITEDPDTYTWWVLKDSGELLAKFDWPRSLEIETVRNGSMYVRDRDWEKGVLTVQRHKIQMEPIN
ncbi:MAG: 6-bladed beta-propeller [Balneolaceae bacterium]|nr:6-bladed beta-propeller [Balneolaceae bacterium]